MTESVSLVADLHTVRCGGCKVLVDDPLAVKCAFCGATFDRVVSNHVGLAKRLMSQRAGGDGGDEQEAEAGDAAALAAGADGYFVKPSDIDEYERVIARIIEAHLTPN